MPGRTGLAGYLLLSTHAHLAPCPALPTYSRRQVGDYQKAGVMAGLNTADNHAMNFDEDF